MPPIFYSEEKKKGGKGKRGKEIHLVGD